VLKGIKRLQLLFVEVACQQGVHLVALRAKAHGPSAEEDLLPPSPLPKAELYEHLHVGRFVRHPSRRGGRTAPLSRLSHPCGPLQPRPDAGVPRLLCDGLLFPQLRNPPVAGARLSLWQQGPRGFPLPDVTGVQTGTRATCGRWPPGT